MCIYATISATRISRHKLTGVEMIATKHHVYYFDAATLYSFLRSNEEAFTDEK